MTGRSGRKLNFTRRLLPLLLAGSLAVAMPRVQGQTGAAPGGTAQPDVTADIKVPPFDVVSVKPNKSESGMVRVMGKQDGYSASNVSLKMLIQGAYGIRADLISGAPSWADSARFDIDAKVADSDVDALKKLSPEQRRLILRPLLADRFKLKVHIETKQLPVYELVLAKGGSKLTEATPGNTYANGIKGPDGVARGGMMRVGPGQLTAQAVPMTGLANMLSQQLSRTVLDKTGLTGKYDIELYWAPDQADPVFKGPDGSLPKGDAAPDSSGPSIFTALQEQLGLKLQSAKGPVETLVIDHVEMPSEN
jgi:uncharacterized protein (TIGR03435 family)